MSPSEGVAFGALFIVLFILIFAIAILPWIFYLVNLSNLLKQIAPHNRRMEPGQVWLVLIPIFGLIWHFLMIDYIASSVAAEYNERRMPLPEERPGYNLGLIALILMLVCGVAGIVVWIMYWVKMAEYKNALMNSQPGGMNTMV